MASNNIVCAQFEIGEDSKGLARAAAFLLAQQYANTNELIASATYTREGGIAFLVLVLAGPTNTFVTVGPGTNTVFRAIEEEIEDQASGINELASAMLAAAYAGLTHLLSFHVYVRQSGIAYAVALMSN